MVTRRVVLASALLAPFFPRVAQAEPILRASTHPLNTQGCLGWWLMGEGQYTATQWVDLLTGKVGTFTSMATPSTPTDGPTRPTKRRGGRADVRLDGVGGHVLIPGTFGNPAAITVSLWASVDGIDTSGGELLSIRDSIVLRITTTGNVRGIYRNSVTSPGISTTTFDFRGDGWHMFSYVVDPAHALQEIYVDATSYFFQENTDAITYTGGGADTYLGRHSTATTNDTLGAIDDVRVWRRGLSEAELRLLYRESLMGYPTLLTTPGSDDLLSAAAAARIKRRSQLW